jgi:hypothetical protein
MATIALVDDPVMTTKASTTSCATGGVDISAMVALHATSTAKEELNEATCATSNSMRSSSSTDNDMLFLANARRWSTSKVTVNYSLGVRASTEADSLT